MAQHVIKQNKAWISKGVVVIYENPSIRERAVRFFERLIEERKFPGADVDWWSFAVLSHPTLGQNAVEKAANADVVVFAMDARGDLPDEIKLWMERWLNKRGEREGALIGLLNLKEGLQEIISFREIYLRHAARRAGMDYLSQAAPTVPAAMPDSIDSFTERAGWVTSVLDDILQKRPHLPPPVL